MRVSLTFEAERGALTLPVHYNHLLQSLIYRNLDQALAGWLHEGGYALGRRRFKLFTFSRLLCRRRRLLRTEGRVLFQGPVVLKIGSPETKLLESLVLHLLRAERVTIGGTACRLLSVQVEVPPRVEGPAVVRALSPICAYRTLYALDGKRKTYFFSPWEREFGDLILDNLQRKARAFWGEAAPLEGAYIKPRTVDRRNEILVNFKGTWIKGWTGTYELRLPEPYFTLAYDAGLGPKNSQGFGMVEVVRDVPPERGA